VESLRPFVRLCRDSFEPDQAEAKILEAPVYDDDLEAAAGFAAWPYPPTATACSFPALTGCI
jgi:hypothetical protein